ncbi:MAG TPA: hypothetical protein VME01_09680 [Solirubrobacteraceae bacterium]|nr:hypothetical protein [Solirubrobacteraceae bacterium]
MDQEFTTTLRLPGYTGGSEATSAVTTFLQANNGGTPSATATVSGAGGGFVGGASCTSP